MPENFNKFWSTNGISSMLQIPALVFATKFPGRNWVKLFLVHGDEGRGRQKQPVMVMATQTIIPLQSKKLNMAGTFN